MLRPKLPRKCKVKSGNIKYYCGIVIKFAMDKIFIKTFSNYNYAMDFINLGAMFFRSAYQFAIMEDNPRHDSNEGKETYMINTKFVDKYGNPTIRIHHPNAETKKILEDKLKDATKYVSKNFSNEFRENKKIVFDKQIQSLIYSLSYIETSKDFRDLDIDKFGDHMVIIKNVNVFMERLKTYFQKVELDFFGGQVQYYPEQSYKVHTILRKNEKYKGEHEYRLIISNLIFKEKLFNIGSIVDIAEYLTSGQLKNFISFYDNDNKKR